MKDKGYLQSLLAYNAWAYGELYSVVRAMPAEEVVKERPTPLKSILVSLNHLVVVDRIWLAHMEGKKHGFDELRTVLHEDLDDLWRARRDTDETLQAYASGLDDAALEETVKYALISGNTGSLSRAMILTHIVTHGNYHRGWIVDMLGQAGVQQPQMDIPVYERKTREARTVPLP
ncbi:MAG: DinB family protein [Rhodospirillales bacterium]